MSAPRSRSVFLCLPGLAAALVLGGPAAPSAGAAVPAAAATQDFNGDGYQDLVVGAPDGTVSGQAKAGYVTVMYGSAHGLAASSHTLISRSTAGIPGAAVKGQGFGSDTSAGDLDGDGYSDLVVSGSHSADSIVVRGGAGGLSGGYAVPGHGTHTATGDFNGDGHTDLLAVATSDPVGDDPTGSDSEILYGPLSATGVPASSEPFDDASVYNIYAVRTGDINGDGRSDLALTAYAGEGYSMSRLYLSTGTGLKRSAVSPPAIWDRSAGFTFGDLNGDGRDDLAFGNLGEGGTDVTIGYGTPAGLAPASDWVTITQDTPGVPGDGPKEPNDSEWQDAFGASLSAGDVNGDGIADLAVGAPGEDIGATADAGYVTLLPGSTAGVTGRGAQAFSQDTAGVPGTAEAGDRFGSAVRLLDINGNGYADLASAAVREDGGNGAVWELRGRPEGLVTDAALVFGPLAVGAPSAGAAFGHRLG
ncbi:FG-GAP-like repeat-containing protein [Streptomyces sp. NBC_00344]|uniref:FG-GAP-like repeat-containing protein n=1 Tax=Streptomyces sp. NBC_00344 TaxID=2975720 RepID=UPI002E206DFA